MGQSGHYYLGSTVINLGVDLGSETSEHELQQQLLPLLKESETICLTHNAAMLRKDSIQDISSSTLRHVLELNIVAPSVLNRLLIPHMGPDSSIIYLGSTLSEIAVANTASYVISKHAVVGQMRATCQDLAATGIHTCCICPGFTDTEMLREQVQHDQAILESVANMSAMGRLVKPKEIAETIFFAAGSPVINGALIHANLGLIQK